MDREQAPQCPNCAEGRMSINSGGSLWCDRCESRPAVPLDPLTTINRQSAEPPPKKIKTGYTNPAPATFCALYGTFKEKAHALGYALACHGSMQGDFDLVAIPWTEEACDAETLVETLRECCGGFILPTGQMGGRWDPAQGKFVEAVIHNPTYKPHGRLAWCINLGGVPRIDLSVMPRIQKNL